MQGIKGELRVYKARLEMACLNRASSQSLPSPTTVGQVNPHMRLTSAEGVRQSVGAAWFWFTAALALPGQWQWGSLTAADHNKRKRSRTQCKRGWEKEGGAFLSFSSNPAGPAGRGVC